MCDEQQLDSIILQSANEYLERSVRLFMEHRYHECIEDCKRAIDLEENNDMAYARIAYTYIRIGDFKAAFNYLNRAISYNPKCALAYCVSGMIYANQIKDYKKAMEEFDRSIKFDSNCAISYYNRGILYAQQFKEWEKALADYNKAIELDNTYSYAYTGRGALYADQAKDYVKALTDYNKAIENDENNSFAYYNRGVLFAEQLRDYDRALTDYNKAIELNSNYSDSYNARGLLYAEIKKDNKRALADYKQAIKLNKNNSDAYYNRGNLYFEQMQDFDKALSDYIKVKTLLNNDAFEIQRVEGKIQEINVLKNKSIVTNENIKQLMESIYISGIEDTIRQTKKSFTHFISEKPPIDFDSTGAEFVVLRRWNSYTPIIAENNHISKGGGYFFKLPDCGIVIDPGFNFIDNFKLQGYNFYEIDHVLITHAHNDHTADLESLLTLLHQYNEMILGDFDAPEKNTIMQEVLSAQPGQVQVEDRAFIEEEAKKRFSISPRRKRIRIYMSVSTYKKYAPMLDLFNKADYDIILIKANDKLPIITSNTQKSKYLHGLEIMAISAKHNDLMSDRDSLGFIIKYEKFVLVYTGDTGFSSEIEEQYMAIGKKYNKYHIVLLAHLGGFKEYEKKYDVSKSLKDNNKFFYKNHLGRLGLAKLIETLKPRICIISEFGEEFRKTRIVLTNHFQQIYKSTFFIPADIGLCISQDNTINLVDKIDHEAKQIGTHFYDYLETSVCECKNDASLHYYKKDIIKEADLREFLSNQYFQKLNSLSV